MLAAGNLLVSKSIGYLLSQLFDGGIHGQLAQACRSMAGCSGASNAYMSAFHLYSCSGCGIALALVAGSCLPAAVCTNFQGTSPV